MTDKELLELAAKAAGIKVYESTDGTMQNRPVLVFSAGGGMGTMPYEEQWNPLREDAQALRLAVKLGIAVEHFYSGPLEKPEWMFSRARRFQAEASCGRPGDIDPYAATRRAIVRAAAEIGATCEN